MLVFTLLSSCTKLLLPNSANDTELYKQSPLYQTVNVPNPAHRFFAIKTIGFLQIKTNRGKIEKNIKSLNQTTSRA